MAGTKPGVTACRGQGPRRGGRAGRAWEGRAVAVRGDQVAADELGAPDLGGEGPVAAGREALPQPSRGLAAPGASADLPPWVWGG